MTGLAASIKTIKHYFVTEIYIGLFLFVDLSGSERDRLMLNIRNNTVAAMDKQKSPKTGQHKC